MAVFSRGRPSSKVSRRITPLVMPTPDAKLHQERKEVTERDAPRYAVALTCAASLMRHEHSSSLPGAIMTLARDPKQAKHKDLPELP